MVYCCVPNCTSDSSKNADVSFHTFPLDSDLKEKWRIVIGRQGEKKGSLWFPNKSSRICSLHFCESDFSTSTTYKRLLPNKLPTVFNAYPSHKQKCLKRRKSPLSRSNPLPPKTRKLNRPTDSNDEEITEPLTKEIAIQVSVSSRGPRSITNIKRKYSLLKKSYDRSIKTITKLKSRLKELKSNKNRKTSKLHSKVEEIERNAVTGDIKSLFLLEQIQGYGMKNVKYGETTLKICVLWHTKAPNGYNFIRSMKCLKLPHKRTLSNYIGYTNGETGTTSLIKHRLHYEAEKLKNPEEKLGSLIIDEMAIKPKVVYDRNIDQFLGYSEGQIEELGISDKVANRLLCFLFRGLSTPIRIPVAFYFTRQLTGTQLNLLTKKVIVEVEEAGFQVLRIVTDNCSVNVNMMKEMCNGTLLSEISHPNDENRPLFLSFDSSHILKNIRSQFLDKDLFHQGTMISSTHLKKLYEIQRKHVVTPIRGLTRKVLFPSNLEKMNVKRAKFIFSTPAISALKVLPIVAPEIVTNIESVQKTVEFLDMVRKWHDIHDICNIKHSYTCRNTDKRIFTQTDDDRLAWLTDSFLPYMKEIQSNELKEHRISQGTYDALVTTTKSTIKCIRYLLGLGFHYILSRNLSSDDIELLFSHLRRKGGFNDMMDARSCLYAIESTLKTGMINPSDSSNVEKQTFVTLDTIR